MFAFTGRRLDFESGLYHYRERAYYALAGRFLQVDPILLLAGPNLYAYVGNDPVNFSDPVGLSKQSDNRLGQKVTLEEINAVLRMTYGDRSDEWKYWEGRRWWKLWEYPIYSTILLKAKSNYVVNTMGIPNGRDLEVLTFLAQLGSAQMQALIQGTKILSDRAGPQPTQVTVGGSIVYGAAETYKTITEQ